MRQQLRFHRQSLDESWRTRTSTFRSMSQLPEAIKLAVRSLSYQDNTLVYYLTRINHNINEIRGYRNTAYIQHMLSRLFKTTYHLQEVAEVFRGTQFSEDVLINRCNVQLTHMNLLKPPVQVLHFLKWLYHFDTLIQQELEKVHVQYMSTLKNSISDQFNANVIKQRNLKHVIHPRKKDMYHYVSQLVTKPKFRVMKQVESLQTFESKYGDFRLINLASRHYAQQLDTVCDNLNAI